MISSQLLFALGLGLVLLAAVEYDLGHQSFADFYDKVLKDKVFLFINENCLALTL
ncbi:MAG: hypothetical protein U9Q58_11695 [Pseudomonadota bacterium]|nr:hypothetical protein [Pseudomonadota bacterium]